MFKRDTKSFSQLLTDPYYCKDPQLYEIFKKCLPPPEAYYYFPKPEDIITIDRKNPKDSIRKIFTNVPFTDFEQRWLKELKKVIDEHPDDEIPDGWNDGMSLGCIYSALCDIKFAYEIMRDYINWFEKTFPMNIVPRDKSWELLNNGFLYIYGRDHQFRPIMVCQPYILQQRMDYFTNEDIVNVCLFVCQFAVNNLLIPGQVENWIMFFNLKGTSLFSLPEPIKQLVQELSDNFNFRLYKCYVLGMSWIMRILYKFVTSFVGQPNEDKIIILSGKRDEHLFDDFNPDNLEQRFGGRAQNLVYGGENTLFPPRVPTNNIFFPYENSRNILITEEEYITRVKKGLIPKESISPFILDKLNKENEEAQKIENLNKSNDIKGIIIKEEQARLSNLANPYPTLLTLKDNRNINNNNNNYMNHTTKKNINDVNIYKRFNNNFNVPKSNDNTDYSSKKTNIVIKKKNYIKEFMSLHDWKIDEKCYEERTHKKLFKYEFYNEIKKFSNHKNKFIKSITKLK